MAHKDILGRAGEDRAADHLRSIGFDIVARNWRCRLGEIDIIALDGDDLVVIEVKTRRGVGFGHPFEAIDPRKRRRLWRLAMAWMREHPNAARGRRLRFDAVGIIGEVPALAPVEHLRDLEIA
ncbi:YraN family protein [Microbacterium fluvii]|uniref:UPF0102 protein ACFQRL_08170 n=1 Tax=Microbacterium fluvii TaxID=415215 RepID=A0ABW2HEN4_9MICO|nr:YraN family protein [Microbacterium fluvii]MCU4672560.1 YraN family protein [Microbacterium fluvii]